MADQTSQHPLQGELPLEAPATPPPPQPPAEPTPPSLRQYFGSPKADDDVFSRLTGPGARSSAMMASQVNLAQVAAPSAAAGVQVAPPGPPQLQQVSEMAHNVEETIKQELQVSGRRVLCSDT